jgi:ferritin-like metal-binding protein YciE
MVTYSFENLLVEQLNDLYGAETQIIQALPEWISVTSDAELRETFAAYLLEVRHHVENIEKMFTELSLSPTLVKNVAIEGILNQGMQNAHHGGNSPVKDAALIALIQRLMHYKMAIYGSARTFARHLDYNKTMDSLQRALNEEGEADRKLTKLAEGGVFTTGINEHARKAKVLA